MQTLDIQLLIMAFESLQKVGSLTSVGRFGKKKKILQYMVSISYLTVFKSLLEYFKIYYDICIISKYEQVFHN